ncbi:MAG: Wzt carbohydrate-binding domain-containing protein [Acidobacteriota bacterium]|nr:Wzt carbohydrate-binding domain-containing protein [Acidobacteriota bacterium]
MGVQFFGDTGSAITEYLQRVGEGSANDLRVHPNRPAGMVPTLSTAKLTDVHGREKNIFRTGEDWFLEVEYQGDERVRLAGVAFDVLTSTGIFVARFETYMRSLPPYAIPQEGRIRFRVTSLPFLEGKYLVSLGIGADPRHFYDHVPGALTFSVEKSDPYQSGFMLTRDHGICALDASYAVVSGLDGLIPFVDRRRDAQRRKIARLEADRRSRAVRVSGPDSYDTNAFGTDASGPDA